MIDENAFGLLISWFDAEDAEYALEREAFVKRFLEFREVGRECLGFPLGSGLRVLELGHALYVELSEGDENEDPIVWLKMTRARLSERDFVTAGVLSHGSRWVGEETLPAVEWRGEIALASCSLPSEPLRRALYADTLTRPDEDVDDPGWGPGLYVDTEAVEALGRKLKNAPTPLRAGGATYYRVGA